MGGSLSARQSQAIDSTRLEWMAGGCRWLIFFEAGASRPGGGSERRLSVMTSASSGWRDIGLPSE
jgi:hypothetical protein